MKSLKGKVVLITGASEGLGKQLAFDLAKLHVKLAIIARTETKLTVVKKRVEKLGSRCEYYVCDVSDENQVDKTAQNILRDFRTVDILINNAGIYDEDDRLRKNKKKIKEMFGTNVLGVLFFTNAFLPFMKKRNSGQIFNVISIAGVEPSDVWGMYVATKYAVRGFTESVRLSVSGTNIKVMGFYPHGMNTNIFKAAGLDFAQNEPWMMKVEDISNIILFILQQPDDVSMDHVEVRKIELN
ncbi:SDR family oxidoreductase [Candidatus Roizmanbacteria bacterium]|nr:SDR family oxidoreductase [Candidatus Roizmanbacteria bacterium]